jgi:hypothetical protein
LDTLEYAMKRTLLFAFCIPFLIALPANSAEVSPYSGQEAREIKALSESEIAGLLAGKGMGYAKAAELNGYPGPKHVLELADELHLSPEQQQQTQTVFARMEASAKALGSQLVDAERRLDLMFRQGTVTTDALAEALGQIGALQAELRGAHLQAHLEQFRILKQGQVARYMELRGYGDGVHGEHAHHLPPAT